MGSPRITRMQLLQFLVMTVVIWAGLKLLVGYLIMGLFLQFY